jgi:hypothetical protein
MSHLRRIVALAVPASLLVALGVALPAQAAPSLAASCTVQGTATTSPAVGLTANTGSYSFNVSVDNTSTSLQFQCLGVSGGGSVDVENLSVTSTGTYNNTVCGTGTADGTNTGITATSLGLPGTTNLTANWTGKDLSYHIDFVGGQGVLQFKDPNNPLHPGTSSATGGGEVTITASHPTVPNGCTDGFVVTGALAGTI